MAAIRGFSLAQISKIKVQFSTFDSRVASARYNIAYMQAESLQDLIQIPLYDPCSVCLSRELFRRVSASKMQESNPKCEVICKVTANRAPPTVDVTFSKL